MVLATRSPTQSAPTAKHALIVLPVHMFFDQISNCIDRQLPHITHVIIYEDPLYFYDANERPVRPHLIKIAYMRACMKYLYESLRKKYGRKKTITYLEYGTMTEQTAFDRIGFQTLYMFDPVDHVARKRYAYTHIITTTPTFLASPSWLEEYHASFVYSEASTLQHGRFYNFLKRKLQLTILENVPNMDKHNRRPLPKGAGIRESVRNWTSDTTDKYYQEAVSYANGKKFKEHVGSPDHVRMYPICQKDAINALHDFINNRLVQFGQYQDAIAKDGIVLFHSCLSAVLNNGLLSPKIVVKKVIAAYKDSKYHIPVQSLEGFLRQIIGWREYMRFLYEYFYCDMISSNISGNTRRRVPRSWYECTVGIAPIDHEISKTLKYGYAHHIIRLMMFMNPMILFGYHPSAIYIWFMEMVAIDAYDWVMIPNIYAMGYFWPHGMRRPYLSSSSYITRMSDYGYPLRSKQRNWKFLWDNMFRAYVKKSPHRYIAFYSRKPFDKTT